MRVRESDLRRATLEIDAASTQAGWDQPSRLFALVPTDELAAAEPQLAAELGVGDGSHQLLTPIEQELDDHDVSLEQLLGQIMWPVSVVGALAVLERVVLPPPAEEAVPADPADAIAAITATVANDTKRSFMINAISSCSCCGPWATPVGRSVPLVGLWRSPIAGTSSELPG